VSEEREDRKMRLIENEIEADDPPDWANAPDSGHV
jgi:hypothetical protein